MTIDDLASPQPALVEVQARISEETSRDLRGVAELSGALSAQFGVAPTIVQGRAGPFERTPYQDDLDASRDVLRHVASLLTDHLSSGRRPVTLASDCALALATLPAAAAQQPDLKVLWLDAHTDFDTPQTSTISFLGCMSLAGATGRWESGFGAIATEAVVHAGARLEEGDFDEAGHHEAETSGMAMVAVDPGMAEHVLGHLGNAPVYVHLDPDVLDPKVNPVPYGRDGGIDGEQLVGLLGAVAARGPVLGAEVTAYHSPDDADDRTALTQLLADAVSALVA
jgi:arginase family enzyme